MFKFFKKKKEEKEKEKRSKNVQKELTELLKKNIIGWTTKDICVFLVINIHYHNNFSISCKTKT